MDAPSLRPCPDAPLGARWDGRGVSFSVGSDHAERIELCLFEAPEGGPERRLPLHGPDEGIWHGYLEGAGPGLLYGYRAWGAFDPPRGLRFNPSKLLVDPYALALVGEVRPGAPLLGSVPSSLLEGAEEEPDLQDSAALVPRGQVIDPLFDWGDDRPPRTPWAETVIYEAHVKGLTRLHPAVPPALRGTYAGLASPAVIEHLLELGITAIELLPVQFIADEPRLLEQGLRNYWGYSPLGWFAPDPRYAATDDPVREFKAMVAALHRAGLEVILDVVYNHSCEGGRDGPTLSLRGLDNPTWYRLDPRRPDRYLDFTGCGNSLDVSRPQVLRLIADSLRYWVEEMHVDGFRFDLAVTLAREPEAFSPGAAFLDILAQDPVLSRVKRIAEPWDVGPGGYQVGGFPRGWSEWNAPYRDGVRRFWRGDPGVQGELAWRLAGSSDLFGSRRPQASLNFVTCHDGFTLQDLVSYERKRNLANGEENRDGHDHNLSWSCGQEGPSEDPGIQALRLRQQKNLLLTLAGSLGVPMLTAGDELGRTQGGNNNAYCQDNETSWLDWTPTPARQELLRFTREALGLRRAHPALRRGTFLRGREEEGPGGTTPDVTWIHPEGREMTPTDWEDPRGQSLGMLLHGPEEGEALLLLLHAGPEALEFVLPEPPAGGGWQELLGTWAGRPAAPPGAWGAGRPAASLGAWGAARLEPSSAALLGPAREAVQAGLHAPPARERTTAREA